MESLIGVDLGGTKIAVGVLEDGKITDRDVSHTPKEGWQAVLDQIVARVKAVLAQREPLPRLGIGVPGPLDFQRGVVKFAPNIYGFRDVPLIRYLSERLDMEVLMENDANAAALAEDTYGAAREASSSLFVTISTGIGGGVVLGGKVWRGAHGVAGEVGHITALPGGTVSGAGWPGGLEAVASGTAIARDASYAVGRPLSTAEAFALAEQGHPVASKVVENALHYLGVALGDLQKVLDPEVIVLGGGVSEAGSYFFERVQAAADAAAAGFAPVTLKRAELGTDAGVIGAALSSLHPR